DQETTGLGLLDAVTTPGERRFVGDIAVQSPLIDVPMTGFENHSSITTLSADVEAFGRVIVGNGNGVANLDGAINGNVFGTYLHGPVLARNPEFADLLLERAVGHPPVSVEDELAERYANWRRSVIK
ncbi:MAG TPA: hypothetical protein VIH79_03610, partial [Candidatus Nanopelagicaceae bacterium]